MVILILKTKHRCYLNSTSTEISWFDKPVKMALIDSLIEGEEFMYEQVSGILNVCLHNNTKSVYMSKQEYKDLVNEGVIKE